SSSTRPTTTSAGSSGMCGRRPPWPGARSGRPPWSPWARRGDPALFPEALEFHVAPWIQDGLTWLVDRGGGFFHGVSVAITRSLNAIEAGLLAVPWWAWVGGVLLAAWAVTRRPLTAMTLAGLMMAIGAFGYWAAA